MEGVALTWLIKRVKFGQCDAQTHDPKAKPCEAMAGDVSELVLKVSVDAHLKQRTKVAPWIPIASKAPGKN